MDRHASERDRRRHLSTRHDRPLEPPPGAAERSREMTAPTPLVAAAISLRNGVSSALRAGEDDMGEVLLAELRDLAALPWAPPAVRTELARALGVMHIVAWREEDIARARCALNELQNLVAQHGSTGVERELLARAWSREHGLADRHGDEARASEALRLLRENTQHPNAGEWDLSLLARALFRAHRAALARGQRAGANQYLSELRGLSRSPLASDDDRLCFARALIDAIWNARNPGSKRSQGLRSECLLLLELLRGLPPTQALRNRLP